MVVIQNKKKRSFMFYILIDGQGIAIRLSKQVTRTNQQLKKHINGYNELSKIVADATLTFDDVIKPDWIAEGSSHEQPNATGVPVSLKRQAIDLQLKIVRTYEEIEMLKRDMMRMMRFLGIEHESILKEMDKYRLLSDKYSRGVLTVLNQLVIQVEKELESCMSQFSDFITVELFPLDHLKMYRSECLNAGIPDNHNEVMEECDLDDLEEEIDIEDDDDHAELVDQYLSSIGYND